MVGRKPPRVTVKTPLGPYPRAVNSEPARRALAIVTLLGIGIVPAGVAAAPSPTCHGETATVVGTPGRDVFRRPEVHSGDVFVLRGGNDAVDDDEKNVVVCGGAGSDDITAFGRAHGRRTFFYGGRDLDYLISGLPGSRPGLYLGPKAPLHVFGGRGHDELTGGQGADTLEGGPGPDFGWGISGDDVVRGGPNGDRLHGSGGDDRLYGNRGADKLTGAGPPQSGSDRDFADGGPDVDTCRAEIKRHCES
jgi:Ca2+-binding RTX toxin-like protein